MPFLSLISNEQLEAQAAAQQVAPQDEVLLSSLAAHIQRCWRINRNHKADIEEELLECLRQRNGVYGADELSMIRQQGGSEIYMLLTASKVRAAASWISDILLPAGDKAWGIEPTPVPDLSPEVREVAIQILTAEVTQAQQAGVKPTQEQVQTRTLELKRQLLRAMQKQAAKAAASMEERIEDQLTESGFANALEEFIDDFATFPAALLKTVKQRQKTLKWGPRGEPVVDHVIVDKDVRVSPFDIYPSPGAIDVQDGNLIEHVRYRKSDLYGLIGAEGYDEAAIRAGLEESEYGFIGDWLALSTNERETLENRDLSEAEDLVDGLHFWGNVSGWILMQWGMEGIEDTAKQYSIEAILIGRNLIRVQLNADPLDRRPYYKACFQNKPGSFWGMSPPMLMRDIQRLCNATARALSNNMGMASGPMGFVYTDLLPQGETVTAFHPWKMFQMVTPANGQNMKPVEFFQPASNARELIEVYNTFESKADDATNVPRYMYGNEKVSGAGQTAQGLAMLLESASKGIKAAIRHIDMGVIRPRIERQYHENMLYIDDPTIKGDLKVVARGSNALLAKAATQARRNEFLAITNNPTDAQIMGIEGRAELLRQMARDMEMQDLIPDDEELSIKLAQMAQQQPQEQDPRMAIEQMRLEFEAQKQQMLLEDAERERNVKLQLAQFDLQGDMMELAGRKELTLEQIKAKLGETAMRERGANERFVAERQIKHAMGSGI